MKTRKLKKDREFWPPRYYAGLTRKQKIQRKKEIEKFGKLHWKSPKAYVGFKTNKLGKSKPSQYTKRWKAMFPDAKSLKDKAKATGVPLKYIDHVYRKGLGAWRTGHRPFASESSWGYARAHSFLLCGKAHYGADSADVRAAKKASVKARKWFKRCKETELTRI